MRFPEKTSAAVKNPDRPSVPVRKNISPAASLKIWLPIM